MVGYSSKGLPDKLGIKPGNTIVAINAPKNYAKLVAPLPTGATIAAKPPKGGAPFVWSGLKLVVRKVLR